MIIDVNKQRLDSDFIELFIIDNVYVTSYNEQVTFRDNIAPYTARTYIPVPIEMTGVEYKSEGAYARPKIVIANVLDTFKDALGVSADTLIGKKITRRRTLFKHLDTGSPSTPPIEAPSAIYVIDRKEQESALSITFELASPFDLAGIEIPSRYIIPNTCSWVYQGAAIDASYVKNGGCTWRISSNNNNFPAYFDSKNNLFITGISPPTHNQVSAYTKNYIYAIAGNRNRISADGSVTSVSRPDYFQAYNSSSGTLDRTTGRRCIPYSTYSGGTTYYVYSEGFLYNDYVLYDGRIWRCIATNVNQVPQSGPYWVRADICGKKVSSCTSRFGGASTSVQFSNIPSVTTDETRNIPYGGFPASRRYNQ